MKPSSNVCGTTTKVPSKREAKKQINIRWNSKIFFQVGLIVSLLAMFFIMEIEIGLKPQEVAVTSGVIWETHPTINYVIDKDPEVVVEKKPTKVIKRKPVKATMAVSNTFTKVPDTDTVLEGKLIAEGDTPIKTITGPTVTKGPVETPTTNIIRVEFVPVFPGCEGAIGNNAKIDCMSSKIRAFVKRKFDTGKFDYFEPGSVQSIYTLFTIDATGDIVDIKARAKDKRLEEEARRVIAKLPLMEPGKQGTTAVNVTYTVPISFQVNN